MSKESTDTEYNSIIKEILKKITSGIDTKTIATTWTDYSPVRLLYYKVRAFAEKRNIWPYLYDMPLIISDKEKKKQLYRAIKEALHNSKYYKSHKDLLDCFYNLFEIILKAHDGSSTARQLVSVHFIVMIKKLAKAIAENKIDKKSIDFEIFLLILRALIIEDPTTLYENIKSFIALSVIDEEQLENMEKNPEFYKMLQETVKSQLMSEYAFKENKPRIPGFNLDQMCCALRKTLPETSTRPETDKILECDTDRLTRLDHLLELEEITDPKDQQWLKCFMLNLAVKQTFLSFEQRLFIKGVNLWDALHPNKNDTFMRCNETERDHYNSVARKFRKRAEDLLETLDFFNAKMTLTEFLEQFSLVADEKNMFFPTKGKKYKQLYHTACRFEDSNKCELALDCITIKKDADDEEDAINSALAEYLQKIGGMALSTQDAREHSLVFATTKRFLHIPDVGVKIVTKAILTAILDNIEYLDNIDGEPCRLSAEQIRLIKDFARSNMAPNTCKEVQEIATPIEFTARRTKQVTAVQDISKKLGISLYESRSFYNFIAKNDSAIKLQEALKNIIKNKSVQKLSDTYDASLEHAPLVEEEQQFEKRRVLIERTSSKDNGIWSDAWSDILDSHVAHRSYCRERLLKETLQHFSPALLVRMGIVPKNMHTSELTVLLNAANILNFYIRNARENNNEIDLSGMRAKLIALTIATSSNSYNKIIFELYKTLFHKSRHKFKDCIYMLYFIILSFFGETRRVECVEHIMLKILESNSCEENVLQTLSLDKTLPSKLLGKINKEFGQFLDAQMQIQIIVEDGKENAFIVFDLRENRYEGSSYSYRVPIELSQLTEHELDTAKKTEVGTGFTEKYIEVALNSLNELADKESPSEEEKIRLVNDDLIFSKALTQTINKSTKLEETQMAQQPSHSLQEPYVTNAMHQIHQQPIAAY